MLMPPVTTRTPNIGELVSVPEHLETHKQKAIAIAMRLKEANIWDGTTPIYFGDPFTVHKHIMVDEDLKLANLILKPSSDKIEVCLPDIPAKDKAPAPEPDNDDIPETPQAWAQYVMSNKNKFVIMDTETTDLKKNLDNFEIVQLSIIDMDGNTLYNNYIKPWSAKISTTAADIHGIDQSKITHAPHLSMEWHKIKPLIEGKHIIAYGSDFDEAALENSLKHNHVSLVKDMDLALDWHCAMKMYAKHNPFKVFKGRQGAWWELTKALEQQRLTPDPNAHNALADVLMTLQLIQSIAEDPENRWKNRFGWIPGDLVKSISSGKIFEVQSTMPSGVVNVKDLGDNWRGNFAAAQLELHKPKHERDTIAPQETIAPETKNDVSPKDNTLKQGDLVKTPRNEIGWVRKILSHSDILIQLGDSLRNFPANQLEPVVEGPQPKPIQITVPNTPKPKPSYEQFEKLIRRFGTPDEAQEWIDLIQEMIDEWKTEGTPS